MTPQTKHHKHRSLKMRRNGPLHTLLTVPSLAFSRGYIRPKGQRLVWTRRLVAVDGVLVPSEPPRYRLTPIAVLHALFGFTLDLREKGRY